MASLKINIESKDLVRVTNRLARAGRTALPNAVKGTLNSAAFDVKKNTMPKSVKKTFKEREKTFFKSTSRVNMASGSRIEDLKSVVGFYAGQGKKEAGRATKNLEQQEDAGQIGGRSFVPTDKARVSNSSGKPVKSNLRLTALKGVVNADKVRLQRMNKATGRMNRAVNKKQQFVRAAFKAKSLFGTNAYVLGNRWGDGNQTLSKINSITKNKRTGKVTIKRTAIYTYKKGRKVKVARTNFMKRAANETHLNIGRIYVNEAIRQLKKLNLM